MEVPQNPLAQRTQVFDFTRTTAPNGATGGNGVWGFTLPAGCVAFEVVAGSAGTGGGSGRRGAAGTNRSGGGGGAGGSVTKTIVALADLPSNALTVGVGAGGLGAPAITTDDTDGLQGSGGGNTFVATSTNINVVFVAGGNGGYNGGGYGGNTNEGPAAISNLGHVDPNPMFLGGSGGYGQTGSGQNASYQSVGGSSPGGGGGGGVTSTNQWGGGGYGGPVSNFYAHYSYTPNARGSNEGDAGGDQNDATWPKWILCGLSGGGASGNSQGAGGRGGNGVRGGGGGGGGASVNGFPSGAGGNGGDGFVRILCFF